MLDLSLGLRLPWDGVVYLHYLEMDAFLDEDLHSSWVGGKIIYDVYEVLQISQLLVLL